MDLAAYSRTSWRWASVLGEHGYQVAPVTIDTMDVMYDLAYDGARGDQIDG